MPGAEPFFLPGGSTGCLLIHGFTGTPFEMRALGEHLNQQGHTVLGVRLSGHGTRPADMIRARWQDWVASVEDGWYLLSVCTDNIVVMGLSMGGMLSLLFSSFAPVAGVVVMASPHHLPDDPRLRFVKPLSIIRPYMPKGEPDWFDEEAFSSHVCYPEDPTRSYGELLELIDAMQAGLPSISAPILLIYSKDDKTVLAQDGHMDQITPTFSWRHSSPRATPTSKIRSRFQVAARADAVGKQVAGTLSFSPIWSASPACLRKPWGPSVTMMEGIPRCSMPFKYQKFNPEQRDAFSSRVI